MHLAFTFRTTGYKYIKESEPDKRDKGYAWHTAIGLQTVDGLTTSEYLVHTAVHNIEGEISFEEANALLQSYYEENPTRNADDRTEEADKVSARIAALLSGKAFNFTPNEYISIHRKLSIGIYSHAGRIRDSPSLIFLMSMYSILTFYHIPLRIPRVVF